jgi:hypothetical protein
MMLVQALKFDILRRKGEGVVLELLVWRGVSAQPSKKRLVMLSVILAV